MTHKVIVATDLGTGDGGKGTVVHTVVTRARAHTVIKRGGAQGSHGTHTSRGERFAFSQWGCGTFEGIPTHLSGQMIISPEGLLNEADALRYGFGIDQPFRLLTVDEEALCATPFHRIASRLKELARGDNHRGTIGTGVGEAYRDLGRVPELALKARDLHGPDLRERLAAVRDHVRADLQPVINGQFLPADRELVDEEVSLLYDDGFLDFVAGRFRTVSEQARIVTRDYLGEVILAREGIAVVETSHGVLTDRCAGFHPHTSAIRTLPRFTRAMLEEAGYDGQIVNLGVTRAYAIRHGAGPLPTANPGASEHLLPGSHKDTNRYQGEVRAGPIDFVLMRYALAACGGPSVFDGLAVTWFDQIQANQAWDTCNAYSGATDPAFFTPSGEIRVGPRCDPEYQQLLGQRLNACRPEITTRPIDPTAKLDELYAVCAAVMSEAVNVPVRMVSFGPTELDKVCK